MTQHLKKIALVSFANQPGGVAAHIRRIAVHLYGRGFSFKIILCTTVEDAIREAVLSGGGVDPKDIIFIPHAKKNLIFPFIVQLTDIFRRERFDVVDAFDDQTQVLAGVAAWLAGIRAFLCHNEGRFAPSTVSVPKRVLYRALNFLLNGYFTRTIALSQGIARELTIHGFRPKHKVEVLNLGIETWDHSHEVLLQGIAQGAPVIGAVSRLSVEKGLERFIRAARIIFNEIPRAKFIICGDGPEKENLMALARELLPEGCMEFRPWVKDVPGTMKMFDVYVFPSIREGLGVTLLEAMAAGRPSVSSDIDGVRDVVEPGVDGILVDTSDIQAFAAAVMSLCRDKDRAMAMGQKAMATVSARFSVEREMQRLRQIYEEIA